jgi:AAA+ ATPase superfamily predicted ATPase
VATGEHFTNRTTEVRELVGDLRSGQNVLVISPRRYGKTSLITTVLQRLQKQHLLVAYDDLQMRLRRRQQPSHGCPAHTSVPVTGASVFDFID